MDETLIGAIITAIITSGASLAGVVLTSRSNARKADQRLEKAQMESASQLEKSQMQADHRLEMAQAAAEARLREMQAITTTKIEELTREVREHNNFAKRMPVVEQRVLSLEHRMKNVEDI